MKKQPLRYVYGVIMILAGLNHFVSPDPYLKMMPEALPWHLALVDLSGVAEILCGAGLMIERTRRFSAWSLIALLVAVFPANLNMAVNHLPLGDSDIPLWALWARLPLQGLLIYWAYRYTYRGASK